MIRKFSINLRHIIIFSVVPFFSILYGQSGLDSLFEKRTHSNFKKQYLIVYLYLKIIPQKRNILYY